LELAEAAQEQEEAEKRAREDEETLRQMREARVESDYEHPVNKDVVDLRESDEEDPHQYEVSSNSTSSPAPVQTYTV
jgi:hypothetical protein